MTAPIYLDHCSTTPPHPEVTQSMLEVLQSEFGNPSAVQHIVGERAKAVLEKSRREVAGHLGVPPSQIVFTGSATEANNMMLLGFALRHFQRPHRIITTVIEHKSVSEPCKYAAKFFGTELEILNVDRNGLLDLSKLESLLARSKIPTLVSVMHMNNEVPLRFPIEDIAKLTSRHEAFFHCDAVQGYVREKINWGQLGISSAVLSPHKFYGPKGIGILMLGSELRATPFLPPYVGGEQESGLRPGTINLANIVGAAKAVSLHEASRKKFLLHLLECQNAFIEVLQQSKATWHWTLPPSEHCPGILNLWFDRVNAQALIDALPHVCLSRGATCSTAGEKHSHIPQTLGYPVEISANVLRISFGFGVSPQQAALGAQALLGCIKS